MNQYKAVVRFFRNYDYRSLYKTLEFPYRDTLEDARKDTLPFKYNFFAEPRFDQRRIENVQTENATPTN